jgi:DNA repair exonuclease SbcCD ATPase subunit
VNLKQLELNNFFSYKNDIIDFEANGIYMIYGTNLQTSSFNGVGKSTIKEAILYAVFGKCRCKSVDDCIYFGKKEMSVSLVFMLGKIEVKIVRGRVREKTTTCKLYLEGKDCTKQTTKQTDKYIEDILGIDYDKFMHSFCFGQSEFDDLKELTSSRLIDFLTSVLEINKLDNCKDKIKIKLDEINNEIFRLETTEEIYSKIEEDIDYKALQTESGVLQKKVRKLEKSFDEKEVEYNKANSELVELKNKTLLLTSEITKLEDRIKFIKTNSKCPLCDSKLKGSSLLKNLKKDVVNKMESYNYNDNILNNKLEDVKQLKKEKENIDIKLDEFKARLFEINVVLNKEKEEKNNVDIVDLEKKKSKLLKSKGILEKSKDVFNSKGLPLYILSTYIPKLELIVNNILSNITDFNMRLKTEKELKSNKELRNVCEIELYKGDRKYPLSNLSNGEEFLITLAIRIGISKLYKTGKRIELLILDECFSSLGKNNIQKVMAMINNLQDSFKKILVISHTEDVRSWSVPHKISIVKDNDVSKIEGVKLSC